MQSQILSNFTLKNVIVVIIIVIIIVISSSTLYGCNFQHERR